MEKTLKKNSESEVTQLCPTLCNSMDCSLSGSSIHGIFQARVLEWIAISFSRGSSWPRNRTQVSHIADSYLTAWASREAVTSKTKSILRQESPVFAESPPSISGHPEWQAGYRPKAVHGRLPPPQAPGLSWGVWACPVHPWGCLSNISTSRGVLNIF